MSVSEAEAKTKWCPFVRVRGNASVAVNRLIDGRVPAVSSCVGSACMAWRQGEKANPDWKPSTGSVWPHDPRHDAPMYLKDEDTGYCGLAGKP